MRRRWDNKPSSQEVRTSMDIEEIFSEIGELGRAQAFLFVLLSLPGPWISFHTFITNFIGADPGWTCFLPNISCNATTGEDCSDADVTVVTDDDEKCRYYESGDCQAQFDTSEFTSIVSEWELICHRSSYANLSQSGFFLGLMIGAWFLGGLADSYGRKRIVLVTLLGCIISGLGYSLASGFLVFSVFRILFGFSKQGLVLSLYSLLVEVVGRSKRNYVNILNQVFFTVGLCLLPLLAYVMTNWRTLCLVISLLGVILLPLWKLIPESPRWLLIQGREEEARAVLVKIARGNGRNVTVPRLKRPTSSSSQPSTETSVSVTDLFRGPAIRHRTLILIVAWFTNSVVYYGLALSAGSMGGGRYISVVLSGLVELPGLYITYHTVNRLGRKWTQGGFMILAGVCCGLWALGHSAGLDEYLTLGLALVGKCAIGSSFCVIYLFSAELFPTEVRNLGMGTVSIASRIGGIIAPIILITGGVSLGLPMVVMGCLGLLVGLLSLHLPETLNQPLPETLAELNSNQLTSAQ